MITKGGIRDLKELQSVFVDSIKNICKTDYSDLQIEKWAGSVKNTKKWQSKLGLQEIWLFRIDHNICGFITLENSNYIDLLYVHSGYQNQRIASKLMAELEKEVMNIGIKILNADVSITAKPFFEKMGFKIKQKQTVYINDVPFVNYQMSKTY